MANTFIGYQVRTETDEYVHASYTYYNGVGGWTTWVQANPPEALSLEQAQARLEHHNAYGAGNGRLRVEAAFRALTPTEILADQLSTVLPDMMARSGAASAVR